MSTPLHRLVLTLVCLLVAGGALPHRAAAGSRFYDPRSQTVFAPFNTRVGSQGFQAPKYVDAKLPTVLERQAQAALDLGSDVFKFSLEHNSYPQDLPEPAGLTGVVDKIKKMPPYQRVLDMPFKFLCMWEYPIGPVAVNCRDGMSETEKKIEYQQLYDLTRFLLQRYQGTGRSFLIGHWEGDWTLLSAMNQPERNPTPTAIQGMIDYYTVRQQAVEDARASLPQCKNVHVYHYAEVNLVQKSIDNPSSQTLCTAVLPKVTVDVVAFSAYNATSYPNPAKIAQRLTTNLDFIKAHAHLSGVWPFPQPVFVSEFGYVWASNKTTQNQRNTLGLRAAAKWGCPLILYWSIFSVPDADDLLLIRPDGTHSLEYGTLQRMLARTSALRDLTRVYLGRNPTEAEQNALMDAFQSTDVSDMLRKTLDGAEFDALGDHQAFLAALLSQVLGPKATDSSPMLLGRLRMNLERVTHSHWEVLLALIDSDEAKAAVPDTAFVHALYRAAFGRPESAITPAELGAAAARLAGGTSRAALWLEFLDSDEFGRQGFARRNENSVSPETARRFLPDFMARMGDGSSL